MSILRVLALREIAVVGIASQGPGVWAFMGSGAEGFGFNRKPDIVGFLLLAFVQSLSVAKDLCRDERILAIRSPDRTREAIACADGGFD